MTINEYDQVCLTDGRVGTVVCVCEPNELYAVDIGTTPDEWDNIFVEHDQIQNVIPHK